MRWLGGGDAWCERCLLRFYVLSFMWVEVEGISRMGVEESWWERMRGAFILHLHTMAWILLCLAPSSIPHHHV